MYSANFSSSVGLEAPDLATVFPQRPPSASADDFSYSEMSYTIDPTSSLVLDISGLAVDDSQAEFNEGFVLFLEVAEDELDPLDRDRVLVPNPLVLVNIEDNDRKFDKATHFLLYLVLCAGPLDCAVAQSGSDSLLDCSGPVPPEVLNIECELDDDALLFDCEYVALYNTHTYIQWILGFLRWRYFTELGALQTLLSPTHTLSHTPTHMHMHTHSLSLPLPLSLSLQVLICCQDWYQCLQL